MVFLQGTGQTMGGAQLPHPSARLRFWSRENAHEMTSESQMTMTIMTMKHMMTMMENDL